MTIWLTVVTMALALPGGLMLALLRLSPASARQRAGDGFVEFFRATPLILQIYWAYLRAAGLLRHPAVAARDRAGRAQPATSRPSTPRLSAPASSRSAHGQWNAGLALGMSRTEVLLRIVLPQAVMRVLPALASTWVSLFKDTSLVSIISVADLSYMALKIRSETYRILEVLTAMAVLYWLMGYPQAKLVDWIHRRCKVVE